MAIARHIIKVSSITYEAKNFPLEEWIHHLAYKELRELQKFNDEIKEVNYRLSQNSLHSQMNLFDSPHFDETADNDTENEDDNNDSRQTEENGTPRVEQASDECTTPNSTPAPTPEKRVCQDARGSFVGRKKAKYDAVKLRQNEKAIRNGSIIAASMRRRTEVLE